MRNRIITVAGFLLIAGFGSALTAQAHERGIYRGSSFGFGHRYCAPPVYGYYEAYPPYPYRSCYDGPCYPPPVVIRTYVPYRTRAYREYAPYFRHHERGPGYYAPRHPTRRY